ncbi:hypothetical protein AGOR_G00162900 [Albula goreensis]|uniref:Uncharacterized protein n=1 Tax=Albula goreensis TaxID=1534307 RepID=A0A8T3CZ51_9TELE|nr:hypothetical protein AGOR_G00162900 [Albula goreensis]
MTGSVVTLNNPGLLFAERRLSGRGTMPWQRAGSGCASSQNAMGFTHNPQTNNDKTSSSGASDELYWDGPRLNQMCVMAYPQDRAL